jgi:tetratricopeptide (TPR) repeat protein
VDQPLSRCTPITSADHAALGACCAAALQALQRGDLEEAQAVVIQGSSLPRAGDDPRYVALCGKIAIAQNNYDLAAAQLRRAHKIEPENPDHTIQLAEALMATGSMSEAAVALEEGIRQRPGRADLLINLAYARLACDERDSACKALDTLAAISGIDPATIFAMAQCYQAAREESKAAFWFSRLARQAPHPRVLNDLARLCVHLRDFIEAEGAFQTLRKSDPSAALMSLHGIAWCRIQRQHWREALEAAVTAMQFDSSDLTTDFVALVKDRLFTGKTSPQFEHDLAQRLEDEMDDYAELHCMDAVTAEARSDH